MKTLRLACALLAGTVILGRMAYGQAAEAGKSNDAPVLLRYHFHAKDVHNMKMVMTQKITQEVQGQETIIKQTTGFGYRMTVLNVDDKGNAETQMTYRSVIWKQDGGPMGTQEYDSTKKSDAIPQMAQGFAGLVDQSFTVKFAPDGQVLEIKGVDEMQQHMFAKLNLPGEQGAAIEKALKEQFGDTALKEMLEQTTRIYLAQPVSVGDSWRQHLELSKGVAMLIDNKYTLTDRSKGIATLTIKSVCKPNSKATPLDLGMMKMGYELSGTQDGTIEVDENTGWIRRSKATQKLSGTMKIESAQLPQPLSVPVTIEGDITVTSD